MLGNILKEKKKSFLVTLHVFTIEFNYCREIDYATKKRDVEGELEKRGTKEILEELEK